MFSNLNAAIFGDPEFKEDAVRETVITPILTRLGFGVSGKDRVIRSKALVHPFIYVGTRNIPVKLIPDYTLLCDEKPVFILDAKAPGENILDRGHVGQAYSYAIHPEIKCPEFGLCNGKQLAIFNVDSAKPMLVLDFDEFDSRWAEIEKILGPRFLRKPVLRRFAPDFGVALSRIGLSKNSTITMLGMQLNLFMAIDANLMTATANTSFAEKEHCLSVDFDRKFLEPILAGLPKELAIQFRNALERTPFQAAAEMVIEFDADLELGEEVDNGDEIFIPLVVKSVRASRFNHTPLAPLATDIPPDVFRLRKAYSVE